MPHILCKQGLLFILFYYFNSKVSILSWKLKGYIEWGREMVWGLEIFRVFEISEYTYGIKGLFWKKGIAAYKCEEPLLYLETFYLN